MRRHSTPAEKLLRLPVVRVLVASAVVVICAAPLTPSRAADSPSVRAAARLKNHPPRGWIRHYLGEDRYKIAGGTWRFVSTELDRFYYPAYAPEMLRQSPGRVIGFASAKDAEEAGYMPGAGYAGIDPSFDRAYANGGSVSTRGGSGGEAAQRVTLADGTSTILVPAGWQRLMSDKQKDMSIDMFVGPQKGMALVMSMRIPMGNGYSAENLMSPRVMRSVLGQVGNSSGDARMSSALRNAKVEDVRLGGLRGITMTMPKNAIRGLGGGRSYIVGTGDRFYIAQGSTPRAEQFLKTVRFR